jgi:Family of unknown function (DUF6314)
MAPGDGQGGLHPDAEALAGDWQIDRTILDFRTGQDGLFTGTGRFSPVPGGLDYAERGQIQMAGGPLLLAERRYLWRFDVGGIAVLFADGRPFHRLGPQAEHRCGDDHYHVAYDFGAWPAWQAVWRVTGPRKDYRLASAYTRA